jgi:cytochrome c biogenesis protein ResB
MWFINKIWNILSSRNVAIILLFAVTFMLLFGSILPNPNFMSKEEVLKLQEERPVVYFLASRFNTKSVAKGYIFGFIGIFLIISTTACSLDRLFERRRLKKSSLKDLPVKEFDLVERLDNREEFLKRLKRRLRVKRWYLREEITGGRHILLAEKGIFGFWGSIFFHAILITLLLGLVIYYFRGYYATMLFTEGQTKIVKEENLDRVYRKPLLGFSLPELEIRLEHFYAVYWKEREPVDYTGKFFMKDISKGKSWEQIIKINEPFRYGGVDFLMVLYGYSPNFIVYDKKGKVIYDSYVALNVVGGAEDSFDVLPEGLTVRTIFFPDFKIDERGYYSTASPLPRNPVFLLNIIDKNRESLFTGLISLGEEKEFDGYRIRFNDLRYWITLNLVKETGIGFFFWCGLLGIVALLVRFIDPDRKVFFVFEANRLSVLSYTKHFEGILKEQTENMVKNILLKGG